MDFKKKTSRSIAIAVVGVSTVSPILSTVHANEKENINSSYENMASEYDEANAEYVLLSRSSDNYTILNKNTNTQIREVYETENGVTRKLSAYEALDRFNNIENTKKTQDEITILNEIKGPEIRATQEFQKIGSTKKVAGSARSLSHEVYGGNKGASISISKGITATVGNEFSVSSSFEKRAIQAGAGFSWNVSANRSLTTTHNVSPKKKGRVKFKPYYNKVEGKMHTVLASGVISSSKKAYGMSPRKISTGMCDGLEYLEER